MSSLGLTSDAAEWFESYLSGRLQYTSCGPELSDMLPVTNGVAQGSIFSPPFVPYLYKRFAHRHQAL